MDGTKYPRVVVSGAPGFTEYRGDLILDAYSPAGYIGIVRDDEHGAYNVHLMQYIHEEYGDDADTERELRCEVCDRTA